MRSKIFIGSSTKSLTIANAVQENLDHDADCTVWNQDIFFPTGNTLQTLVNVVESYDFGIFIFGADDIIKIGDREFHSPRDNVIFELGLFIGQLGIERSFFLVPRDVNDLKLPTDLLGITPLKFSLNREDNNIVAATGPACNKIKRRVKELNNIERYIKASLINGVIIHQAAAVCYKQEGTFIKILLIKTGSNRWSFPKGTLKKNRENFETAKSEAYNEAGVTTTNKMDYIGIYYDSKHSNQKVIDLSIAAYLLKVDKQIDPFEKNRNPTWFELDKVVEALSKGRNYSQISSIEKLIFSIKEIINKNN